MSIPPAEEKQIRPVSRAEFYATVSSLYFFPALLFLISGGIPEGPPTPEGSIVLAWLRLAGSSFMFLTMMGMSLMYTVMAFREKGKNRL